MKIARRVLPKPPTESEILLDRVTDRVGGFLIMVEASLNDGKRFSVVDILSQWWRIAFKRMMPHDYNSVKHIVIKIASKLYLDSCREFKVLPGRDFIELHSDIMHKSFHSYSDKKTDEIVTQLNKYINLELPNFK